MKRELPALNTQPPNTQKLWPSDPTSSVSYPGGFIGAGDLDPYTPLLRAYANDRVQVRVLVGAHELNHSFAIHGVKWLAEPSDQNSGHLAVQPMGISEHFEMLFTLPPAITDPPVKATLIGSVREAGTAPLLLDGETPEGQLGYQHD